MPSSRAVLAGLVAVLAVGNLMVTFLRSGIPREMKGRVVAVEIETEKHSGIDDVHLVTIEDRTLHLDEEVASTLGAGNVISKGAWSRKIEVDGQERKLGLTQDLARMLIAMPLVFMTSMWLLFGRRRRGP